MSEIQACERVKFSALCKVLDKISNSTKPKTRWEILNQFVSTYRKALIKDETFYPCLRLLLPQLDRERGAYGIKENKLANLYIRILCLSKQSPDAQKLLNFRTPKNAHSQVGDFAEIAYFVLKNRCPDSGDSTLLTVNDSLDIIAQGHAAGDKEAVETELRQMLRSMSASEQKWLIRIIMKELKLGVGQNSILNLFHPDAKDLYDVTNNLSKICTTLKDPSVRLHEIEISLFNPFRPMLAERGIMEKLEKQMDSKSFFIETKHDGERCQLHKEFSTYKYFSRNGFDFTTNFGGDPYSGSFTPHIHDCFSAEVQSCIIDGEMVGWNKHTNSIGSKGENFDVKNLRDDDMYQPCLMVFDVLFYNGAVLSSKPLKERLDVLKDIISPKEGRMDFTHRESATTKKEVADALNEAIDQREEGIVLKDPESAYRPNTRKGGWLKVKPEYVDSLMEELDLIIIGGYFGEGRRRGFISHFLMGVARSSESSDTPKVFESFCRIGSGYSLQELYELLAKLAPYWRKTKKNEPPPACLAWTREKPDVWIEPKNSQILQVKAAEIVDSDVYQTACTLRFPRVEHVRYDKPWYQCLTTDQLKELKEMSHGKLAMRHVEDEADGPSPSKRRAVRVPQIVSIPQHFKAADTSKIKRESEVFVGREICVTTAPSGHTKQDLERRIVKMGGTVIQNPGLETFCVLASRVTLRVRSIMQTGRYNVVEASWLLECEEKGLLRPWTPLDMIHSTDETKAQFAKDFDGFGDSYTKPVTEEELKVLVERIEDKDTQELSARDVADLEDELFPEGYHLGIFRMKKFYLDMFTEIENPESKIQDSPLKLISAQLRFYGGKLISDLSEATHVVVHASDASRIQTFKEINRSRKKKLHLVDSRWVSESVEAKRLMFERTYYP